MHFTPLLVNLNYKTFEDYIQSLSKSSKKNFRSVFKKNFDLEYLRIEFDVNLANDFMNLWESKEGIEWGFNIKYLNYLDKNGKLMCFVARNINEKDNILSLHIVENYSGYIECHTPLYDKKLYNERSLAKYMWFNLIKFTIESGQFKWLDLGGGNNGNWRELLYKHSEKKTVSYKWAYVGNSVKEKPENENPFVIGIKIFPYEKYLKKETTGFDKIIYLIKKKIIVLLYYNMGNRGNKIFEKLRWFFKKKPDLKRKFREN